MTMISFFVTIFSILTVLGGQIKGTDHLETAENYMINWEWNQIHCADDVATQINYLRSTAREWHPNSGQ